MNLFFKSPLPPLLRGGIFSHSVFMIFDFNFIPLPLFSSGFVTIHFMSKCLFLYNSFKKGTHIGADEKNTTLYLCGSYIFCFDHTQENTLSITLGNQNKNQYLLSDKTLYLLQCGS